MKLPKTQLVKTTNTRSKEQEEEAYLSRKMNRYEQEQKQKLVELGQGPKPYRDILSFLKNEIDMSTKMTNFRYELLCFRDDGVYQLNKAIEKLYGVSRADNAQGPSGKQNIETIDVKLANGSRVKVPYGQIDMPDMGEGAGINIKYNIDNNILYVQGSCEFKYASFIDDIIDETKRGLANESIFKNQAIEIGENCIPKVLDISNIEDEFMILSEKTEYELRPLMSRIQFPERCIQRGVPLKTGVLLEGPYGTGKKWEWCNCIP